MTLLFIFIILTTVHQTIFPHGWELEDVSITFDYQISMTNKSNFILIHKFSLFVCFLIQSAYIFHMY